MYLLCIYNEWIQIEINTYSRLFALDLSIHSTDQHIIKSQHKFTVSYLKIFAITVLITQRISQKSSMVNFQNLFCSNFNSGKQSKNSFPGCFELFKKKSNL